MTGGTDAMHLATPPVVSPESKKPASRQGFNDVSCVSKLPFLTDYDRFCVRVRYFLQSSFLHEVFIT